MYILPLQFATPEYDELVQLRADVLRKPLGMVFTPEFLANEWQDTHLAIYDEAHNLLGGLMLSHKDATTVQMRQVAIAERLQNQGIGKKIVAFSEQYAVQKGYKTMYLHARQTAVKFYEQQGYTAFGLPFEEVGIPHREMQKAL
jgi:predicted GNAT family N-acyltransferase